MNTQLKYMMMTLITAMTITACKKDETGDPSNPPPPTNEEEVITTVKLTFVDTVGEIDDTVRYVFQDLDGAGGNAPIITTAPLASGASYIASIQLLNESVSPIEDITIEVQNEAEAHQFFYAVGGANINWGYADADANGHPVGIRTNWSAPAGPGSTGTLLVTLRHEPDKAASGVSSGDITNAGGETDVEVQFPMQLLQ